MKISLVMIVKNEERKLGFCLDAVKTIVDEIVVVDTGSKDNTREIALSFGASVYDFKWGDDFSKARNFALSKSTGDWNLILDADEIIINGNRQVLEDFANNNSNTIGSVLIKSKFVENGEINYSKDYIPRFAPKSVLFSGKIHEQLDPTIMRKIVNLTIDHSGYFETDKSKRNVQLIQKALEKSPKDTYLLYQMAKTLSVSGDYAKASPYFKKAYKDINFKMGYAKSFIVAYLYNLSHTKDIALGLNVIANWEAVFNDDVDFNFACGIYYLNLALSDINKYVAYISKIEASYLKCISLGDSNRDSVEGVGSYKAFHNLAAYYETMGLMDKAKTYYDMAAKLNYEPSIKRLSVL